jgi:hypothetical protein
MTLFFGLIKEFKQALEHPTPENTLFPARLLLPGRLGRLLEEFNLDKPNESQEYQLVNELLEQQQKSYYYYFFSKKIASLEAFSKKIDTLILSPNTAHLAKSIDEIKLCAKYYLIAAKISDSQNNRVVERHRSVANLLKSMSLLYHQGLLTQRHFSFLARFGPIAHTTQDVLELLLALKEKQSLNGLFLRVLEDNYKYKLGALLFNLSTLETSYDDHFNRTDLTKIASLNKKQIQTIAKELTQYKEFKTKSESNEFFKKILAQSSKSYNSYEHKPLITKQRKNVHFFDLQLVEQNPQETKPTYTNGV